MKVSLTWLRDYVDVTLSADALARRLTEAGIEVESVTHTGGTWEHVWVARITKVEPHPNADRLRLVTADYGQGRSIRVVTGAPNIAEEDVVPLGLLGTEYLDGHVTPPVKAKLEPRQIRGILTEGMVMSGFELGLSEDHSGILQLPKDTQVGLPLAQAVGQGESVIELDLKGRADCLAMTGVAREVSALTGAPLHVEAAMPVPQPARSRRPDEPLTIEIEDPALCSRFSAVLLRNVKIGPSPQWMQDRLTAAGIRAINNVVDITNFVMLEWGQPLHAYDYDRVRGGRLVARPAREGETLLTLAEERSELALSTEQLVIADAEGPVGLAGVIGGRDSEVRDDTTSILLEAANFDARSIRRTARALLPRPTEASRRFERGIPPEHTMPAALRAAQLMIDLAGADMVGDPVDTYPAPKSRPIIRVKPTEFERLLGVSYTQQEIEGVFDRLQFVYQQPGDESGGDYLVHAPVWRLDIERPADLVEEVARVTGYDRIPTSIMRGEPPVPVPNTPMVWEEAVRDTLVGLGFGEIQTYTMTSEARLRRFPHAELGGAGAPGLAAQMDARIAPPADPVRVANPASQDEDVMRTSAIPSVLETLAANLRYLNRDAHFFEVSRIFVPRESDLPEERRVLTLVTGAQRTGPRWGAVDNDFYYVKDVLEEVLTRLGVGGHGYVAVQHPGFHPYQAAAVVLNHRPESGGRKPVLPDEVLGIVGQVDEVVRETYDIGQPSFLVALDLDRLIQHATRERQFHPWPHYEAVVEDLAFVVSQDVPGDRVASFIRRAGAPLVESVRFFDLYEGERVPAGTRSLAYTITFRAPDRQLTNDEVAAVRAKIVQQVERQTGAKLRG